MNSKFDIAYRKLSQYEFNTMKNSIQKKGYSRSSIRYDLQKVLFFFERGPDGVRHQGLS